MKTAITVLQEMMVKLGKIPEYECLSKDGPPHQATFQYRCVAQGLTVTAQARSKKEAKQESARKMLLLMHSEGYQVPSPYDTAREGDTNYPQSSPSPSKIPALECGGAATSTVDNRSYVALLKELCEQYQLGGMVDELTGDTGPAHQRRFTVSVSVGGYTRIATATTKKAARQLAAEQLYTYLKNHLERLTGDFVEKEALSRALEKAMKRYVEDKDKEQWRPDLSQKIAEFHLDEEKRTKALMVLREGADGPELLEEACAAMGLDVQRQPLSPMTVLVLAPTSPSLTFAGSSLHEASCFALRYLRRALLVLPPN